VVSAIWLPDTTSEPDEPPQAASKADRRLKHAIVGSAREGRYRSDTDAPLVRVNLEKYRFIEQNPVYFQSRAQALFTRCDASQKLKNPGESFVTHLGMSGERLSHFL
jgi:hypothetical protein